MLFTAGVSSNLCLSLSRWLGKGCMNGGFSMGTHVFFAFLAFGRTPGLDVGVWREGFAR
jgi:hypothetical protein